MSRSKYQRPEVYPWKGKSGEKFWKAEWRQYIEGRPKPKHRAVTWPCAKYTKAAAQAECDKLVREETSGPARPDGSMTVTEFWTKVFYPVRYARIGLNSRLTYDAAWRHHIQPVIGKLELQYVTKNSVEQMLDGMATAGMSASTLRMSLAITKAVLAEAHECDYIAKNPARKATLPRCNPQQDTRSLTEVEVCRLLEKTEGRDRLWWRIMVLTGLRISEMLALTKEDVLPIGLRISKSALHGQASTTKNKKIRIVPLAPELRKDIEQWAEPVDSGLLFPTEIGRMFWRQSETVEAFIKHGRDLAGIPDLTPRMCRTTFATLWSGDPSDVQGILGHHNLKLTMDVYRKPVSDRQQATVQDLEARFSGKVVPMKRRA